MFSWLDALKELEESRTPDEQEPPAGGIGLSGLPLPSPLKPATTGSTAFAATLAPQKPVAAPSGRAGDLSPSGVPLSGVGRDGWVPGVTLPKVPGPPTSPAPATPKAFEPLPTPTFGAMPAATPPPPLVFDEPQRVDPGPMPAPPPVPFGTMASPGYAAPQDVAFPAMTPPPAMPEAPGAPAPIQFAQMGLGGTEGLPGFTVGQIGAQGSTTGSTGASGSQSTQSGSTSQTGSTTNSQQGSNTDFNTVLTALGLARPVANFLTKNFPPALTEPGPTVPPMTEPIIDPVLGQVPTGLIAEPPGSQPYIEPLTGPGSPIVDPEFGEIPTGLIGEPPLTAAASSGGSQGLLGQGVTSVLGPEAGQMVNQAIPYVGAVLTAAFGLASGKPPEQALLQTLPSLMQSPGARELIGSTVTSLLGQEAAGLVGSALPYAGQVLSFAMGLAGGQDPGQAVLNTAIGVAAAALAPETAGLSVVVGALLQFLLGGMGGPSEAWQKFGGKVGETNKTNIAAVDALVPKIIAAKSVEELEAARAEYIDALYGGVQGGKLDPETGQPMTFTPHDGEYLPGIPGATGTAHEWGKTFNPNGLNAAINNLYGTKLTSLTQGLGDPDAAMRYLMGILPMIQHGATGVGGNPGTLPSLYPTLTSAGPSLPPLTPAPPEPVQTAGAVWTGSA